MGNVSRGKSTINRGTAGLNTNVMDYNAPVIPPRDPVLTEAKGEVTYGMKAVRISFNPSGDPAVHQVKSAYANIIDQMNDLRSRTEDPEVKRLASVAITEAQTAQMWAVNALTWK